MSMTVQRRKPCSCTLKETESHGFTTTCVQRKTKPIDAFQNIYCDIESRKSAPCTVCAFFYVFLLRKTKTGRETTLSPPEDIAGNRCQNFWQVCFSITGISAFACSKIEAGSAPCISSPSAFTRQTSEIP